MSAARQLRRAHRPGRVVAVADQLALGLGDGLVAHRVAALDLDLHLVRRLLPLPHVQAAVGVALFVLDKGDALFGFAALGEEVGGGGAGCVACVG